MPGVHVSLADVLGGADPSATGALWRLEGAARQLDANVIRRPPGSRGTPHVEPDLDVLVVVVEGGGTLHRAGGDAELTAGNLAFVPRGEQRAISAGPDGLVYVTAHRRRPGMTIANAAARAVTEGGEAPCLLPRVCQECGRVSEDSTALYCGRCGTRLPTQTSGRHQG
ncbi:cupin domain-containing protein [Streptomyces beihaiensis]|uniref:Cupin domain-containing protein n=1 Tax=Streptomyces beihaiensis TaxID=2984495 RepID=A0ABT3U186_9ACTN|nr:cupin domain-containing protein [Streptomyces beihaiensis]MCX3063078.1 cupin domain-containing protein [Streptomyces beihaiensis]